MPDLVQPGLVRLGERDAGVRVRSGRQVVDVHADDPLRGHRAERQRDARAEVAALRAVPLVAEPPHQLGPGPRDPGDVPAALVRRAGEAVPRDGRDHQVEVARQRLDHVLELQERAGPAVGEDQCERVGLRGADVDEVDVLAVDLGGVVRQLVEPGLVRAPVVAGAPVSGQFLEPGEGKP
ncbi:hypothetical protein GCM10027610_029750 [Dactylosporangium cerinum]